MISCAWSPNESSCSTNCSTGTQSLYARGVRRSRLFRFWALTKRLRPINERPSTVLTSWTLWTSEGEGISKRSWARTWGQSWWCLLVLKTILEASQLWMFARESQEESRCRWTQHRGQVLIHKYRRKTTVSTLLITLAKSPPPAPNLTWGRKSPTVKSSKATKARKIQTEKECQRTRLSRHQSSSSISRFRTCLRNQNTSLKNLQRARARITSCWSSWSRWRLSKVRDSKESSRGTKKRIIISTKRTTGAPLLENSMPRRSQALEGKMGNLSLGGSMISSIASLIPHLYRGVRYQTTLVLA